MTGFVVQGLISMLIFTKSMAVIVTTNNNFARYCFIKGRYIFAIVDKFETYMQKCKNKSM